MARYRKYSRKRSQKRNKRASRKTRGGMDNNSFFGSDDSLHLSDLDGSQSTNDMSMSNSTIDSYQNSDNSYEPQVDSRNTTFESQESLVSDQGQNVVPFVVDESDIEDEDGDNFLDVEEDLDLSDDDGSVNTTRESMGSFGGKRRRSNKRRTNKRKPKRSKKTRKNKKKRHR